jgi:hypothetical protein
MALKQRQRPTATKPDPIKTTPVRVRATRLGEYEYKRRRVGDVFVMRVRVDKDGDAELPSWVVEAPTAELKETGAQAALTDAVADVVRGGGSATAAATASNGDDLGI